VENPRTLTARSASVKINSRLLIYLRWGPFLLWNSSRLQFLAIVHFHRTWTSACTVPLLHPSFGTLHDRHIPCYISIWPTYICLFDFLSNIFTRTVRMQRTMRTCRLLCNLGRIDNPRILPASSVLLGPEHTYHFISNAGPIKSQNHPPSA
jgi:hypothetical protein